MALPARFLLLASAAALLAGLAQPCSAQLGLLRVTGSGSNQPQSDMLDPALAEAPLLLAYSSSSRNLGLDHNTGSAQVFVQDLATNGLSLASVNNSGQPGNGNSIQPAFSADGRYVAFASHANNLVAGPAPGVLSVYRRDRQLGVTVRVANGLAGAVPNAQARYPTLSASGRFVAFHSSASNLVSSDSNGQSDLFVADLQSGLTERVSLSDGGGEITLGALENWMPSLSADARYAVFASNSTNVVPSPSTGAGQIYLRDRQSQRTHMLSVSPQGQAGGSASDLPVISPNGRFVAFRSFSSNLVAGTHSGLIRVDRSSGSLLAAPLPAGNFACTLPTVNDLGEMSFICSAASSTTQVWLFRPPSSLFLLSTTSTGAASNGTANGFHAQGGGGRLLAYSSTATDIVTPDTNLVSDLFLVVDVGRLSQLFSDGFED
jgi:hypothetical protein